MRVAITIQNVAPRLLTLIEPIVRRACRTYAIRRDDQPDLHQEVAVRILGRINKVPLDRDNVRYVRCTARLEARKLCRGLRKAYARDEFLRRVGSYLLRRWRP